MAWIRLDDDYINHPKFVVLSHHAFRLWHEGMAYCRKSLTDGLIPREALKSFRYAKAPAVAELCLRVGQLAPLWETHEFGWKVHDYLDWNAGYEEEQVERLSAKLRMRAFRGRRKTDLTVLVTPDVTPDVTRNVTVDVTPSVPGQGKDLRICSSEEINGKPYVPKPRNVRPPIVCGPVNASGASRTHERDLAGTSGHLQAAAHARSILVDRAGKLVDLYRELYAIHRNGARLLLVGNALEFNEAIRLCETWDDARLEKLAVLVLKTDDEFISKTDRSFRIFAMKASWADDRLSAWEKKAGVSA